MERHNNASPKTSVRVTVSFQITRLAKVEIKSELFPTRVVTETEPVLMAAVLNIKKQLCATPYKAPQNKTC